ncbi:MAG TPA: hypothetical protein EYH25_00745 [Thermotoga sp.]|nr:hypothetical protein [Thermotoga sp.]
MEEKKEYLSTREVAKKLGISESTMKFWMAKYPEIKKIPKIEKKIFRIYYRWPLDAPEKIRKILYEKKQSSSE